MKILIVKTSSMGDILHALPVAYDLRQAMPDAVIHWVAEESFADIARLSPCVDEVKTCAFRRWRKALFARSTREEVARLKADLRNEHYDVVLDIQGLARSGLLASWARGKETVGYTAAAAKERLAALFYTKGLNLPASIPAVLRYRMAAAATLGYTIDTSVARYGLRSSATPSVDVKGPFAALCVNTSRDTKLWSETNWTQLGLKLLETGRRSVFFWGNATEKARVERIAATIPEAIVAPRDTLLKTAALISMADVAIGVDTGLTHMAAALGRPSVGIFVSTPIDRLSLVGEGPVKSLGETPSVEAVWQAVTDVLPA